MRRPDDTLDEQRIADQRTRRLPRIPADDDNEVEIRPRVVRHVDTSQHVATSSLAARKAQQAVWYFFGVLETILAIRFILMAVGANPANPFFSFVRGLTEPLVAPFANLVETPRFGDASLELGTIFAMVIYLLLAIAVAKLVDLLLTRGDSY